VIKKILTLINGKSELRKSSDFLFSIKRVFTDELISVEDNEVLELHSPILIGTSRIHIKGSGRVTV